MKFFAIVLLGFSHYTIAGEDAVSLNVAVAANFRAPFLSLRDHYQTQSRLTLSPTFGSSGLLAAQIRQGAPFDVFLSADAARPAALIGDGYAEAPGTIYAEGRVALWVPRGTASPAALGGKRLAIANPKLAPYGLAATQCLREEGIWAAVEDNLVYGNNVSQVHHFVNATAVPAGFVALSQLLARDVPATSYWLCPRTHHDPIEQRAVVVAASSSLPAARHFVSYLASPEAQALIASLGYPSH